MKRLLRFTLAIFMLFSVAACSGEKEIETPDLQDEVVEDVNENVQEDVQEDIQEDNSPESESEDTVVEGGSDGNDNSVSDDESDVSVDSEVSVDPEVSDESESGNEDVVESAFDTSWASNEYEKLIPQPPFEGWTGKMVGDNVYEISTSQANADGSGEYYAKFGTYLNSLKNYDFSVDGDEYSAVAYDPEGNEIRFKCGDGWAWITFMPVNNIGSEVNNTTTEETDDQVVLFDSSWANNDMEKLIPKPPMVIARSYDDGGTWIITNRIKDYRLADQPRFEVTQDVTRVQALEYLDLLRSLGFIEKSPVYENKTEIEDAIGAFFLTPDEKFSITIWHKDDYNMTISIVHVG